MVCCATVALFLLNGGEAKIGAEIVHVLAGVCLNGAGRRLIDIKYAPVMVSTTADVGESQGRAQWKFTLERNIPVPSDWRLQTIDERSDGQWRSDTRIQ